MYKVKLIADFLKWYWRGVGKPATQEDREAIARRYLESLK